MVKRTFDLNPQFLRLVVTESAANTFTEADFPTPVMQIGNGKLLVMEMLRILADVPIGDLVNGDAVYAAIYDRARTSIPGIADHGVLFRMSSYATITTSGGTNDRSLVQVDLTDGAGNGLLYARDTIRIAIAGGSQGSALQFQAAILYRMKEISAEEYIGIVND